MVKLKSLHCVHLLTLLCSQNPHEGEAYLLSLRVDGHVAIGSSADLSANTARLS
jgi:hypothetical protein